MPLLRFFLYIAVLNNLIKRINMKVSKEQVIVDYDKYQKLLTLDNTIKNGGTVEVRFNDHWDRWGYSQGTKTFINHNNGLDEIKQYNKELAKRINDMRGTLNEEVDKRVKTSLITEETSYKAHLRRWKDDWSKENDKVRDLKKEVQESRSELCKLKVMTLWELIKWWKLNKN